VRIERSRKDGLNQAKIGTRKLLGAGGWPWSGLAFERAALGQWAGGKPGAAIGRQRSHARSWSWRALAGHSAQCFALVLNWRNPRQPSPRTRRGQARQYQLLRPS